MIIVDTNVVSEFMRTETDPKVAAWAAAITPQDLAITTITIQEIEYGIGLLPDGHRRDRLQATWEGLVASFTDSFVTLDHAAASATARLLVTSQQAGRRMSLADAQIAGCCLSHNAVLATRNAKDFAAVPDLSLINPFTG